MYAGVRLVVGLGNPGREYHKTRHNSGWMVIAELVGRHQLGPGRSERRARVWDGRIAGQRVKLAQPLTFMNRSGESVRSMMEYYQIALDELLIIHDDLDTPFGDIKLRPLGGHGGHNGLRSIQQHLNSKDFARLRFGIGRPPGKMNPVDFVLQPFTNEQRETTCELMRRSADAVEMWLRDGIDNTMSAYNGTASNASKVLTVADLEEKLAIVQRARELAPQDPIPLTKLIALQKKLGRLDAAVVTHLDLAALYEAAGEEDLAVAEKTKAVAIKPELVDLQRGIAEWHRDQNNSKKAVNRYLILARHYMRQNDIDAARETVDAALALNPLHPKSRKLRQELEKLCPESRPS